MSATEISKLLSERRNLVAQIRALDPQDQQAFDDLSAQVADIDGRVTALEESMASAAPAQAGRAANGPTTKRSISPMQMPGYADKRGWDLPSDSAVLRSWLRFGTPLESTEDYDILDKRGYRPGSRALEFRTGSVGTGSLGGYSVNTQFLAEVSRTLKATAPIMNLARVLNTDSGSPLYIPSSDDTSNAGRLLSENTAGSSTDVTFGQISLSSFKLASDIVKVSRELLQDSSIDLASFIGEEIGRRIGRGLSSYLTTGAGTTEPTGIITSSGTVNAGSATAIAIADLMNLQAAIDPAYLDNGAKVGWMMHNTTWFYIRKLLDGQNRPLVGDMTDGTKPMLLGYPVYISNSMDSTIASTKKSVFFGAFNQFVVRQAGALVVTRTDDRYWEYDQVAFQGYLRFDSKALQAGGLKVLLH